MDKKEPISFDFVFGGFKQRPKEDFEIKNNGVKKFERKYPSEPGKLCKNVLSDKPLFVLINSYTTGLQPMVLQNILNDIFTSGQTEAYEVGLKTEEAHILLPCGASGITIWKN